MHFLFKRYEKDEMTFLVEKNDIFRAGLHLQDKKWDADKQVRIVSDVRSNEAANYVEQVFGKVSYTFPHCAEVETQALEGRLFQDLSQKDSKEYKLSIEAVGKEVFGV
jgi:hypothetical protein